LAGTRALIATLMEMAGTNTVEISIGLVALGVVTGVLSHRFLRLPASVVALAVGISLGIWHRLPEMSSYTSGVTTTVLFGTVGLRIGTSKTRLWAKEFSQRLLLGELLSLALVFASLVAIGTGLRPAFLMAIAFMTSSVALVGGATRGGTPLALSVAASDDLAGLAVILLLSPDKVVALVAAATLVSSTIALSRSDGYQALVLFGVTVVALFMLRHLAPLTPIGPLAALSLGIPTGRYLFSRLHNSTEKITTVLGQRVAAPVFFLAQGLKLHSLNSSTLKVAFVVFFGVIASRAVWIVGRNRSIRLASATTARGAVTFVTFAQALSKGMVARSLQGVVIVAVLLSAAIAALLLDLSKD
jgi:hypothetical protein